MELYIVMMEGSPFRAFLDEEEAQEFMEERQEDNLNKFSLETVELQGEVKKPVTFTDPTTQRAFRDGLAIASNNIENDPHNMVQTVVDGAKQALENKRPIVFRQEEYERLNGGREK